VFVRRAPQVPVHQLPEDGAGCWLGLFGRRPRQSLDGLETSGDALVGRRRVQPLNLVEGADGRHLPCWLTLSSCP
jgi:hypothetical protein